MRLMLHSNQSTGRFYDFARWLYPLIEPFLCGRRQRLIQCVNAHPAGEVLEIGVGTGSHLRCYAAHRVTAVDVSAGMLTTAEREASGTGIVLQQMDGEHLAFPPESFDYAVMCHVLSVTANPARMLGEAHRVLRAGGRLFVLNHETPRHALRHWDRLVSRLGWLLRLRLWFRLAETPGWQRFTEISRDHCGLGGYYTLAVLQK